MTSTVASKEANYEVLSREAVRKLHQNFMEAIEKKAKKAVPENAHNPSELVDALKVLLIACARKQADIGAEELAKLAKENKKSIINRTYEIEQTIHSSCPRGNYPSPTFSDSQKKTLNTARRQRKDSPEVLKLFDGEERIYLQLKGSPEPPAPVTQQVPGQKYTAEVFLSEAHRTVSNFLASQGYRITDYNKGYATDKIGKQQFKIGKLLKEHATLYKAFVEDSTRTLGSLMIVISRNAEDIARMSTGRAWSSCMGAGGFNFDYVPEDVKRGTLIAYMISAKDPDICNPLSRILIKPFFMNKEINLFDDSISDIAKKATGRLTALTRKLFGRPPKYIHDQIFVADSAYGIKNDTFSATVKQFVEEKLNQEAEGTFYLPRKLYPDGLARRQRRRNGKTEPNYY